MESIELRQLLVRIQPAEQEEKLPGHHTHYPAAVDYMVDTPHAVDTVPGKLHTTNKEYDTEINR